MDVNKFRHQSPRCGWQRIGRFVNPGFHTLKITRSPYTTSNSVCLNLTIYWNDLADHPWCKGKCQGQEGHPNLLEQDLLCRPSQNLPSSRRQQKMVLYWASGRSRVCTEHVKQNAAFSDGWSEWEERRDLGLWITRWVGIGPRRDCNFLSVIWGLCWRWCMFLV